jgi:hypothetical protein
MTAFARWKIRYDDGSMWDSTMGQPRDIPFERRFGVLWILQGAEHDRLFNKDNYLWREDWNCWIECDDSGLKYQLARATPHVTCYMQGSTVPRADWMESMAEMDREYRSWQHQILT